MLRTLALRQAAGKQKQAPAGNSRAFCFDQIAEQAHHFQPQFFSCEHLLLIAHCVARIAYQARGSGQRRCARE